jgi:alanine racemase
MLIRPTYAKVNLSAIKRNIARIKESLPPGTQVCAVDKANGYGHGSVMVAKAAIEAGATFVAVAIPEEATLLRDAGVEAPILVLGPASLSQWRLAAELDLSMVIASEECLACAKTVHKETGHQMRLHLKVDTGMHRVGVQSLREAKALLDVIAQEEGLLLEGLMTHFAAADEADKTYTDMQNARFQDYVALVRGMGFAPVIHAANSGGALDCPGTSYDMVRVGIAMYGCYPSGEVSQAVKLEPALSLHTHISFIKTVSAGDKLSYGCTFEAPGPLRIATIPIGYADGYNRLLSNRGEVLVRGQRARIVGRVCMDQTLIDVTEIPEAVLHDDVVCIGPQGYDRVTTEELAAHCGTINYEILCALSERVPRLYYEE